MVISTRLRAVGAGLATVVLMTAGTLIAQEGMPPAARRSGDSTRRVPDFFGQIGLTPEQREAIYKIRGKHQAKIDELEKQIDEVQAQMLGECEGVLTDTQKQMLAQRRKAAGAGKKAEESEKAKGKTKSDS
jgi:Spy/CpxP family protein refolding chaperone